MCWAILEHVVRSVYSHDENTWDYIFMKDQYKGVVRLFKKTAEDIEDEEEDEELWLIIKIGN